MKKLVSALFVLALIASGPAFAAGEVEQAASAQVEGFDWRNYEGEEIRFLALKVTNQPS